jgi:hypothetical protein
MQSLPSSTAAPVDGTGTLPFQASPKFPGVLFQKSLNQKPVKSVEVCGIGKVPLDKSGEPVVAELEAKIHQDMAQWRAALLNSGDVRPRAVALMLDSIGMSDGVRPSEQALASLTELAQTANDPAVYAIALSVCRNARLSESEACKKLSAKGWTKLDPGNASAWLEAASAAHAAHDIATENAAYAEAAKARKIDGYNWSLLSYSEADMPSNLSPLERWEVAIQMIGIEAAMVSPAIASKHCTDANVRGEVTREQCGQLAELLVTKGGSLLDLAIGTSIGERVGWPAARVAALKEEKDALLEDTNQIDELRSDTAWTCDAMSRREFRLHESLRLGELNAARESLDRSGYTRAELAQRYREALEKMYRAAREEAFATEKATPPP